MPPPPPDGPQDGPGDGPGDGPHEEPRPEPPYGGAGDEAPYGGTAYPPPPPGGSYPPPPYGDPSAGYGTPGPGYPAAGPLRYSPTEAIGYGWRRFRVQPAPLLLGTLVVFVASLVVSLIGQGLVSAWFGISRFTFEPGSSASDVGFFSVFAGNLVLSLLSQVVITLLSAGLVKAALLMADGRPVSLEAAFADWDKLQLVLAAVLTSVATSIGFLLLVVPGVIVAFLTSFTTFFVVDRRLDAIDAIRASVRFTADHVGDVLVFGLLALVVLVIGACLCGVGLLVAWPVALLGAAFTFRVLHGQQVAALPR